MARTGRWRSPVSLAGSSAADFATRLWTGPFGSTPTLQGRIDTGLVKPSRTVVDALDADVDIGSTFVNPPFTSTTLGVSAITCPSPASAGFGLELHTDAVGPSVPAGAIDQAAPIVTLP